MNIFCGTIKNASVAVKIKLDIANAANLIFYNTHLRTKLPFRSPFDAANIQSGVV